MPPPKKKGEEDIKLSNSEKAALLLNTLGENTASLILKNLKDNDIRRVVSMMGKMKKAPVALIKNVLQEFYKSLSEQSEIIFGSEYSKEQIIKSLGEDRARLIFGAGGAAAQQKSLEALEMVDTRTLANYLVNEHPQTVALIIAHLPAEKKSEVLKFQKPCRVKLF